nr:5829_t:CDS:2 [Entrophospora candida]
MNYYKDSLDDVYSCLKRIKAADELALDDYLQHEQNFLINYRSEWIRLNFIKVYELTLELPALTILKNFLLSLLCYQPKLMFNSASYIKYLDRDEDYKRKVKPFENLFLTNNNSSEFLLSSIRKNYREEDINIFDATINSSNNATNTSNTFNNTTTLSPTPSIHIPSSYIISHYRRSVIIDSTIINISHVGIIANWIKGHSLKLDELRKIYDNPIPIPFYFKLLIRGSRDGFSSEIFHKWCDDYGAPTLIIIKLKNSLQIIGGFNYSSWKSPFLIFSTFQHDRHAFIFSLCNTYGNKDNFKLARPKRTLINDGWKALKFSRYAGPCFGKSDLQLRSNKTCYCKQHDYDDSITDKFGVFEIDDYEVFRKIICI